MTNQNRIRRIDVWRLFLETYALVMRNLELRARDEQAVIPLEWFDVLIHLNEACERRMRMGDLANCLVLVPSNITRLIDRMEEAGLVRREPCPEDRRAMYAVMTSEGAERFKQMIPGNRRRVEEIFLRHLDEGDVEVLYQIFNRIYEANKPVD